MNTLQVKCIKCGKEWEKESVLPWGPDDYSSSLCRSCFVDIISPLIHKRQRHEGNFDCFGKAGAYCDQIYCKYRQWCLHIEKGEQPEKRSNDIRPLLYEAKPDGNAEHQLGSI